MIEEISYQDLYPNIRNGDLLVWSKRKFKTIQDILPFIVRSATMSDYNHVALAFNLHHRNGLIEAEIPFVRVIPLGKRKPFYHIPMGIEWDTNKSNYLLDKLGEDYSVWQAITGYFGNIKQDNKWQCVELARDFYVNQCGIDLPKDYTPSKFVENILMLDKTMKLVV